MEKVTVERVYFEAGTMSAPAFFDVWLDDGTHMWLQGKLAKKAASQVREGSEWLILKLLELGDLSWKFDEEPDADQP